MILMNVLFIYCRVYRSLWPIASSLCVNTRLLSSARFAMRILISSEENDHENISGRNLTDVWVALLALLATVARSLAVF